MKPRRSSNDTATNNGPQGPETFVLTKEYRRFAEFCDACRNYRYIGLCYGSPGVGKTLSARYYANWDAIEASLPVNDTASLTLTTLLDSNTIFYTPGVFNTPVRVEREIGELRHILRSIHVEDRDRKRRICLDRARQHDRAEEEERRRQRVAELDGDTDPPPESPAKPESEYMQLSKQYHRENLQLRISDPTTLVIIDEADRLKMAGLEQVRDIFDKGHIGMILIGMPGIEKRLARYPQLYSRVGFVHAFRPLTAAEVSDLLLQENWRPAGVSLVENAVADKEALAAIIRITGGNFRLLHRLIAQIARIMWINELAAITTQVVEAARESLVIGTV